jgi:eukaryotic-like serine/threonine-protein kinase
VTSLIGRQLGGYVLESELGRGSMGVVYRARSVAHGTTVAVKVLLDALSNDISFITRFIREARVIARLHHPNVIQVLDAGREGPHIYFVMEYFQAVTATHLLHERQRLPSGQVIEIAIQAADALDYAHVEGRLVHRDIKPDNLLVNEWNQVKLLDFGLARIQGMHSITQAGTVVGSLYYVCPEQILGQKLDGRADVYALGVSMYELLTGQRPYVGQTLMEMSDAILSATAIPPSQLEPSVPRELEHIIARAMARELEHRSRTAGELRDDLRALQADLLQGQPTMVTPVVAAPGAVLYGPRAGKAPTHLPRASLRANTLRPVPSEQPNPPLLDS